MNNFAYILTNIIIPIFIAIAVGYGLQKKFKLNVNTLSRVMFYVFIPSLLFVKVYSTSLSKEIFLAIALYTLILFCILYILSLLVSKVFKYPYSLRKAFINSTCFYNSGNYCLPLIQLLYNDPIAVSVNVIIMLSQNIASSTIGVFNSSSGSSTPKQALVSIFKMPMLYSIALSIFLRAANIKVWAPLWSAADMLSSGFVPLALLVLGMQLANTTINFKLSSAYVSNFVRLIISPMLSYIITLLLGLHGIIAQVMIITAAAPTAVNTVLMAIEFDNEPEFSSQAIFSASVFSTITVTAVIYLAIKYV